MQETYISRYRNLPGSPEALQKLFVDLVRDLGTAFVVIDGVDEAEESGRNNLLKSLLAIKKECSNIKLLVSCRADRILAKDLERVSQTLRVDHNNAKDIKAYISTREASLISQLQELGGDEDIF
jgi:hypothetical protein